MDQKRLFAAIALSIGILLLFDLWNRPTREAEQQRVAQRNEAWERKKMERQQSDQLRMQTKNEVRDLDDDN